MLISIIIPVWNQGYMVEEKIPSLINNLEVLKEQYEIIFIDDGSVDNTPEILKNIRDKYTNIKIISINHTGQHSALFEGFKIALGKIIITMAADQEVNPKYIPDLLNKINEGYDIVVAWRAHRPGLNMLRRLGSCIVNYYANFITGASLHDHACSLKAYRGSLIKDNISRPQLKKYLGILVAKYTDRTTEVKVACNQILPKESSFGYLGLAKLFLDLIFNS